MIFFKFRSRFFKILCVKLTTYTILPLILRATKEQKLASIFDPRRLRVGLVSKSSDIFEI